MWKFLEKMKKFFQNYLYPNLTKEDITKSQEIRDARKKSLTSLDGTLTEDAFDPLARMANEIKIEEDKDDVEEEVDEER